MTAEEWAKLMQFYDVDHTIIIKKNNTDLQTEPSKCKRSLNYFLEILFTDSKFQLNNSIGWITLNRSRKRLLHCFIRSAF